MKPIRTQVLVKPFPSEEKSEGGIFVPDTAKKPSNKVKIVAVGNGFKNKLMLLKEGQTGFRVQDWGQEVLIDGELHFLMEQSAIIAAQ